MATDRAGQPTVTSLNVMGNARCSDTGTAAVTVFLVVQPRRKLTLAGQTPGY